jgi:hypothetical protein
MRSAQLRIGALPEAKSRKALNAVTPGIFLRVDEFLGDVTQLELP